MTPMIDVVFQLLAFFVMSFKLSVVEGDFNIKMPLSHAAGPSHSQSLRVLLKGDQAGQLAEVRLGDRSLGVNWQSLRDEVRLLVEGADPTFADAVELEIVCDPHLKYAHTMHAIDAISGYVENGRIHHLIRKVHLAPPMEAR